MSHAARRFRARSSDFFAGYPRRHSKAGYPKPMCTACVLFGGTTADGHSVVQWLPFSFFLLVAAPLKWSSQKRVPFFSRVTEQLRTKTASLQLVAGLSQYIHRASSKRYRISSCCRISSSDFCNSTLLRFTDNERQDQAYIIVLCGPKVRMIILCGPTASGVCGTAFINRPTSVWVYEPAVTPPCRLAWNPNTLMCRVMGMPFVRDPPRMGL